MCFPNAEGNSVASPCWFLLFHHLGKFPRKGAWFPIWETERWISTLLIPTPANNASPSAFHISSSTIFTQHGWPWIPLIWALSQTAVLPWPQHGPVIILGLGLTLATFISGMMTQPDLSISLQLSCPCPAPLVGTGRTHPGSWYAVLLAQEILTASGSLAHREQPSHTLPWQLAKLAGCLPSKPAW